MAFMDDWKSKYDYELHPRATPEFPAPIDFPERAMKMLSKLLTEQYGEEYGVTIRLWYEYPEDSNKAS